MYTIEPLGEDRYGKSWVVRVEVDEEVDLATFLVFSADCPRSNIIRGYPCYVEAKAAKRPHEEAWLLDIRHTSYITKRMDQIFAILDSSDSVIVKKQKDEKDEDTGFENRRIGQLLVEYIEKWAKLIGIKSIYGFLSSTDDVEKLKHFYHKCGWQVKIFNGEREKSDGKGYIGKVSKILSA